MNESMVNFLNLPSAGMLLVFLSRVFLPSAVTAKEDFEAGHHIVSSIGSERATSGAGGKIVTFNGKTHVVWQDVTEKGYFNRVRTFQHTSGKWTKPFTLNHGKDNHARPVITVDKQGMLHVILSGHNSPIRYRRSVKPNDASAWTDEEKVGSGTYPVLACNEQGTLFLTVRNPQGWDGVDFYVKKTKGLWQKRPKPVMRDPNLPGYAAFQTGMAWDPTHNTLHMVVDFYESKQIYKQRGIHQAVCYLRTQDEGISWQRADGSQVKLPARPPQMDILARSTEERRTQIPLPVLLSQGSIVVDSQAVPHIFYISHLDTPGQYIHATPDAQGVWQQTTVDAVAKAYPKMRPIAARGSLSIDAADTLYALLELVPLDKRWIDGKPVRGLKFTTDSKKLVWVISRDRGKTFTVEQALEDGAVFNQANLERLTGQNEIIAGRFPPFIYFEGLSRYPKPGEIIQNDVYFLNIP
jgi:hypothetical protein